MSAQQEMLIRLYQSRLEELREMAVDANLSKAGNVEQVRAALIVHHCLSGWDLSSEGIKNHSNSDIGSILATLGIKRSGSIKEKKQRLWLHLNKDPKQLNPDMLDALTRDALHELCIQLSLPRSGSKSQLLGRVAGVLASQANGWGKVKKSLRRPRGKAPKIPLPPLAPGEEPDLISEDATLEEAMEEPPLAGLTIEEVLDIEPLIELPPLQPQVEPEPRLGAPMALPATTLPAVLEGEMSPERQLALRTEVERFVTRHEGEWSFEEEAGFRAQLRVSGLPMDDDRVSQTVGDWMAAARDRWHASVVDSSRIEQDSKAAEAGSEQGLLELEQRMAELDASLRDFLLIGDVDDDEDVASYLDSLADAGFQVSLAAVRSRVLERLGQVCLQVEDERSAFHIGPGSWREREALRRFEKVRPRLVEGLESILEAAADDHVQARMAFERLAGEHELDLSMATISGRLHGLFDLHLSLDAQASSTDPKVARRERMIRILQHGAVHLSVNSQKTLDRLERNVSAFEAVVESILRKHDGEYGPAAQALLIRFMESRGYQVNTPELRPRVVACAGIIGVELGFLSPKDVPPLPSGISLSETEIDAVVAELRSVVRNFKDVDEFEEGEDAKQELQLGESVAEANEDLHRARIKLGRADVLLNRLRVSGDED